MKYTICASLIFFSVSICLLPYTSSAEQEVSVKKTQVLEKRVADLEKEAISLKKELAFTKMPPVPDQLYLCDKAIPLSDADVREDFEREFYQFLENKGLLTILVKRHGKFISLVSTEIDRMNMPQDLIYLALTESYLNPRAKSSAQAGGMWQFIKETGKREGLFINDAIDERYSIIKSTRSALGYLKKLNDEFGDWFLAMAAYNCGEGRIRESLANQNTRSFFELFLPEETDRYLYRIAAIKEILGNPGRYGLPFEKKDFYKPYAVAEIPIDTDREIHTACLSQAMDVSYKVFREYNLQIRKYKLAKGAYLINVPAEKRDIFMKGVRGCPGVSISHQ
jgi:membrane-bound lytic murein transglycosylase D